MIILFRYQLCFRMNDGDPHIEVIDADEYINGQLGDTDDRCTPSVVFQCEVPNPDPRGNGELVDMTVFEVAAHLIIYIRTMGEVATLDAQKGAGEQPAPAKETPHGGYPDPDQEAHNQAMRYQR